MAIPDITGLDAEVAAAMISGSGLDVRLLGSGKVAVRQSPAPGALVPVGTSVKILTSDSGPSVPKGFAVIPDVRHMSIRRAINRLTMEELDVSVTGSGLVVNQFPAAGLQVKVGTRVTVRCEAKSSGVVAMN